MMLGEQELPLPDFNGVTNFNDVQQRFVASAEQILRGYCLVRGNESWPITSLELYLFTASEVWRDPYAHQHSEQQEAGTWYVHRPHWSSKKSQFPKQFRPARRSGIDITCGSKDNGIYAGLLIRQTCGSVGSGTAFTRIMRPGQQFGFERWRDDEKDAMRLIDGSNIHNGPLKLARCNDIQTNGIWIGRRVGLKLKKDGATVSPDGVSFREASLRLATHKADGLMDPLN